MRSILFLSILFLIGCKDSNNCSSYNIDSGVDTLQYDFVSPVKNPFKMEGRFQLINDDTIIFNGEKVGPSDTIVISGPQDYYGPPGPKINYQKYKAKEVDIKIEWCFY